MPDPSQIDPRWKKKPMTEGEAKEMLKNPYVSDFSPGFLGMPRHRDYSVEIENLTERIEDLENLIKSIFDGHVLIDGQFRKISV